MDGQLSAVHHGADRLPAVFGGERRWQPLLEIAIPVVLPAWIRTAGAAALAGYGLWTTLLDPST